VQCALARRDIGNPNRAHDRRESSNAVRKIVIEARAREIEQMPKVSPVGVRFKREVKLALEKLAKSDDRTISYVINKIVLEYLRAKKLIK
jgi:hypothetical protein